MLKIRISIAICVFRIWHRIHNLIRQHDLSGLMLRAFDTLPEMKMTPHQARQRQIKGEVETVTLDQLVGRISANMILPYPPGVPLLMPGK